MSGSDAKLTNASGTLPDNAVGVSHLERVNKVTPLPKEILASMARRRELHAKRFRDRLAALEVLTQIDEERRLRRRVRSHLLAAVGVGEDEIDRLKRERNSRLKKAGGLLRNVDHLLGSSMPVHQKPLPLDSSQGELWWAATSVTCSVDSLVMSFQDEGLHFAGKIEVSDENLWYGSMHVLVQFGLGPDRMPFGANFLSNPVANVVGNVQGMTCSVTLSLSSA